MRCCKNWPEPSPLASPWRRLAPLFAVLLLLLAGFARAGSIEPVNAALVPGDDGPVLSAEFAVDLGPRLEDAVTRGVPLYFNLEFSLERKRWYWVNEHLASIDLTYRLAYHALTRQYRLTFGGLHQNFDSLSDALRVISRVSALPVVDRGGALNLKAGETYQAAVRLSLDHNQLPKPLQVDAIANRDWQVDARALRWQFAHKDKEKDRDKDRAAAPEVK